jgi:L-threonylcarbamoyladenylate synthase
MLTPASEESISAAAALLRQGGCVAFPTETVYGLGADATNPRAVARIFSIKQRPSFDPLIVHVAEVAALEEFATDVPPPARALASALWPGPLTIVLPKRDIIPDIVTAGLPSVALRVPDHPVALTLIRRADRPIAAPSANPFGYISPTRAEHVDAQLGDLVPVILDGGPCRVGLESTIVSFATGVATLLRPGAVTREAIEDIIGPLVVGDRDDPVQAPGQLPSHYAPRVPLKLVTAAAAVPSADRREAALLSIGACGDTAEFARVAVLSPTGDLEEAAANLFATMRELDATGISQIYAVAPPERGIGRAIADRLRRAATRAHAPRTDRIS